MYLKKKNEIGWTCFTFQSILIYIALFSSCALRLGRTAYILQIKIGTCGAINATWKSVGHYFLEYVSWAKRVLYWSHLSNPSGCILKWKVHFYSKREICQSLVGNIPISVINNGSKWIIFTIQHTWYTILAKTTLTYDVVYRNSWRKLQYNKWNIFKVEFYGLKLDWVSITLIIIPRWSCNSNWKKMMV